MGPHLVSGVPRPGCRGHFLLVPGPPGGAGARRADWSRGAETAGHEEGGARLAVAWSREEAEGTMSGRNFNLSTTERVIKGAGRARPSSSTRGERPSAGRRRETEGYSRGGEGAAVTQAASVRLDEDPEGVWDGGGGSPPRGVPGHFLLRLDP